jgi:hypothetical protein
MYIICTSPELNPWAYEFTVPHGKSENFPEIGMD